MKKSAKNTVATGRRRKEIAEDRRTDEGRRDDAQPDSPRRSPVRQDDKLIGARRFPRKGDDD